MTSSKRRGCTVFLQTVVDSLEIERNGNVADRTITGLEEIGALVTDEMLMIRSEPRAGMLSFNEQRLGESPLITLI